MGELESDRLVGLPNCTGFAVYFSWLLVPTRPRLMLRSVQPSAPQRSRSRFHSRNAQKQPTQHTAAKKRAGQEDAGSDYLLADSSAPCLKHAIIGITD